MSTTDATGTLSGTYTYDPSHSRLGFVARHAMITKVRGSFNDVTGSGVFDETTPANSHFEVTIDVKSIDTRNADRDNHLRSNDFFDMDTYPTITFASTAIEGAGSGSYRVTGDLTIKGTSKAITFELDYQGAATDPFGNQRIGFEGTVEVNRKDWGLTWNAPLEAGGVLIGEKVTLEFEISAVKAG